jgi:hypothetical protein
MPRRTRARRGGTGSATVPGAAGGYLVGMVLAVSLALMIVAGAMTGPLLGGSIDLSQAG